MVWEEKGKSKWVNRVKDDKVVCDLDDRATGHISCDDTLYMDRSHTTLASMWTNEIDLEGTQPVNASRKW